MIVSQEGNTKIITQQQSSYSDLASLLLDAYDDYANDNVIVVLNSTLKKSVDSSEILEFLNFSNQHRANKHSFVIVVKEFDVEAFDQDLIVVPTLQEAKDIIEMEEIERDLGF